MAKLVNILLKALKGSGGSAVVIGALRNILISLGILILVMFMFLRILHAESNSSVSGNVNADLRMKVQIPEMAFIQVGSLGSTVDTVVFESNIIGFGTFPGDISPEIKFSALISNSQSVIVTADSSNPLVGVSSAETVPMSQIRCTGSGDFSSINNLPFNNTSSQVIWSSTGRGQRSGTFSYTYTDTFSSSPDDYEGSVTYTISIP